MLFSLTKNVFVSLKLFLATSLTVRLQTRQYIMLATVDNILFCVQGRESHTKLALVYST